VNQSATQRFYDALHAGEIDEIDMYHSDLHYALAALKSNRVPQEVQNAAQDLTVEALYEMCLEEGLLPHSHYDFIPLWYRRKHLTPKRKTRAQRVKEAQERAIND
jgi:hypothetical protein